MRPKRLYEHSRRVEAQSNDWKQRYHAETGSLRGRIAQLEARVFELEALICDHFGDGVDAAADALITIKDDVYEKIQAQRASKGEPGE
jgi:hypothetical protein